MNIVTIGSAMRDVFINYSPSDMISYLNPSDGLPYIMLAEGKKIEVDSLHYGVGGGALNSAVAFTRLGISATPICKIGIDDAGHQLIQALDNKGVHTNHIHTTDKYPTGTSFIIPSKSGNRATLVYRGANLALALSDLSEELIKTSASLYMTSLNGDALQLFKPALFHAHQYNKLAAVNPGTYQITHNASLFIEALNYITILIVNAWEAHLLLSALKNNGKENITHAPSGKAMDDAGPQLLHHSLHKESPFSLFDFFHVILNHGLQHIVVTNGKEGVYATDGKMIYFHPSIQTATVVSTLGAGDAFGSTFVASLLQNKSLVDALRAGIINSSHVLAYADTQTGLLTRDLLEQEITHLNKDLLQEYSLA